MCYAAGPPNIGIGGGTGGGVDAAGMDCCDPAGAPNCGMVRSVVGTVGNGISSGCRLGIPPAGGI